MPAEVHSHFVNDGEQINFTVEPEATGVTTSGTSLTFSPGSHNVKIHLPNGYSEAGIEWVDSTGQMTLTQPGVVTLAKPEGNWVELGLDNNLSSTQTVFFQLSGTQDTIGRLGPVIRSDPPPSLVLESS